MPVLLVVEDDSDLLQVLSDALADEGWTVLGARSGSRALRIARAKHVDVVLADLSMPGGNALDLEDTFRATPTLSKIPFVLMTGSLPELTKLGRRSVLLKPFEIHDASAVLAAALHRGGPAVAACYDR